MRSPAVLRRVASVDELQRLVAAFRPDLYSAALLAPTGYAAPEPLIDALFIAARTPNTWLRRTLEAPR